jgi:hypothetical protein
VLKLDADVSFESDFFERLLAKFDQDPRLGIASGTCYELIGGEWRPRHVIARHARGATRAYRWACLQDVLPLVPRLGWDSIDELRANARGWRTTSFLDLPFRHHRPLGEREGRHVRAWLAEGETDHFLGYRPLYLIARTIHHLPHDPAAIGLVGGYARAMLARRPQLVDAEVRRRLREEQRLRNVPRFRREARGRRGG